MVPIKKNFLKKKKWVRSLVRELRSCMLLGTAKNTPKNIKNKQTNKQKTRAHLEPMPQGFPPALETRGALSGWNAPSNRRKSH